MNVQFYGYSVTVTSLRKGQMILAQAEREKQDGDIDTWYHAGCPVGKGYAKWKAGPEAAARAETIAKLHRKHRGTRRQAGYHGAGKYSVQFFDNGDGHLVADYNL